MGEWFEDKLERKDLRRSQDFRSKRAMPSWMIALIVLLIIVGYFIITRA